MAEHWNRENVKYKERHIIRHTISGKRRDDKAYRKNRKRRDRMAVSIQIKKEWEGFGLNVYFQGEAKRIGILGASGSGKSMALKSIAGIETPEAGMIEVDKRI